MSCRMREDSAGLPIGRAAAVEGRSQEPGLPEAVLHAVASQMEPGVASSGANSTTMPAAMTSGRSPGDVADTATRWSTSPVPATPAAAPGRGVGGGAVTATVANPVNCNLGAAAQSGPQPQHDTHDVPSSAEADSTRATGGTSTSEGLASRMEPDLLPGTSAPQAAGSAPASATASQDAAGLTSISDLPLPAVKRIIQLARPGAIPCTNRFARVCQKWREASNHSEGAAACQVYMDLNDMSEASISKASAWLSMYGQQVDVLVLQAEADTLPARGTSIHKLQWFHAAASVMSQLTWLEVGCKDSLMLLAPVLGQLPHLKQLAARVTVGLHIPQKQVEEAGMQAEAEDAGKGAMFVNKQRELWKEVPDLALVCPHLINLHLTFDPDRAGLTVDQRLVQLLPACLQQLVLVGSWETAARASSLAHMSAVQQLTLHDVSVKGPGAGSLAQRMEALQQLRVTGPSADGSIVTHLAPKVTERLCVHGEDEMDILVQLPCLTCLRLDAVCSLSEATADAVGQLTGLQELGIRGSCYHDRYRMARVVQQAVGLSSLRHLQLNVEDGYTAHMAASLGQCRQLTSVHLHVTSPVCVPDQFMFVPALQQLKGLRCLMVPAPLLLAQGGTWLAPLTNLSRLVASVINLYGLKAVHPTAPNLRQWAALQQDAAADLAADGLLNQVCAWPDSLHTVVVLVDVRSGSHYFAPMALVRHPPGHSGAGITVWLEWWDRSAQGWARPFRHVPHLPGVWELQGPAERTLGIWC